MGDTVRESMYGWTGLVTEQFASWEDLKSKCDFVTMDDMSTFAKIMVWFPALGLIFFYYHLVRYDEYVCRENVYFGTMIYHPLCIVAPFAIWLFSTMP